MDRDSYKRTAAAGQDPAAAFLYDDAAGQGRTAADERRASRGRRPAAWDAPSVVDVPVAPQPGAADVLDHDFLATDPRDEHGRIACWTVRGCAGIWGPTGNYMELDCPHNEEGRYSPCPQSCAYTRCQRPWHAEAVSFEDLLDPTVDRMSVIKEQCRHCLHFIKHGPRVGE